MEDPMLLNVVEEFEDQIEAVANASFCMISVFISCVNVTGKHMCFLLAFRQIIWRSAHSVATLNAHKK